MTIAFDQFWNSEWAVPVEATVRELPTQDQLRAGIERLHERVAATGYPIRSIKSAPTCARA